MGVCCYCILICWLDFKPWETYLFLSYLDWQCCDSQCILYQSLFSKYLVFFKARDADALTAVFSEYTAKKVKKQERPSVLKQLAKFKEMVKNMVPERNRKKELER